MRIVRIHVCLWLTIALPANLTHAEDRPTLGLLYNVKETGSLNYDCSMDDEVLVCEFVQVSVRIKSRPSNRASELDKARKSYPQAQLEIDKKQCEAAETLGASLRSEKPPAGADLKTFDKGLQQMTPLQKKDLENFITASLQYCEDPTEAHYLAIIEHGLDIDARTCLISVNPYKQRFKQVAGSDVWAVAQEGPEGMCGVINVSRFELDKSASFPFWKYFAKKAVTNKTGELIPGMSCSDLDEGEYEYDWRSENKQISCDYLRFGLF